MKMAAVRYERISERWRLILTVLKGSRATLVDLNVSSFPSNGALVATNPDLGFLQKMSHFLNIK
jgi:hypothetical protein